MQQVIKAHASSRTLLKGAWRVSPPSRFLDYKDFLRTLHSTVEKQQQLRYPYVQFSKDLGFDKSNVSYMVIHRWRHLSHEQGEMITQNLGITGAERRYFLKLIEYTDARHEEKRKDIFSELVDLKEGLLVDNKDKQMLQFFSKWHHAAIFELVALPDFQSDPEWISAQFYRRLSVEDVKESLKLLESMGLIKYDDQQNRHFKVDKSLSTGDEVRGLAVVGYHFQMLEMAAASMTQVPHEEREIASITLAVNEDLLKRLKDDIRMFKRYATFLSDQCQDPKQIVQLNLQLFSITGADGG